MTDPAERGRRVGRYSGLRSRMISDPLRSAIRYRKLDVNSRDGLAEALRAEDSRSDENRDPRR